MIKDKYSNILEHEFVPLEDGILDVFKNLYEINKKGEIRTISSGKIRKITKTVGINRYPIVFLSNQSVDGGKPKQYYVHRLVAETFLVKDNPTYNEVDHIDHDTTNYNVSNLRWCNRKINVSNSRRLEYFDRYYSEYDLDWNYIQDVPYSSFELSERRVISRHVYYKTPYNGKYYKYGLSGETKRYLDRLGLNYNDIDTFSYVKIPRFNDDNILISKEGILKVGDQYTPGSLSNTGYYIYKYKSLKGVYSVHRLVYETFSGVTLDKSDIIDHINTVTTDNRYENLNLTNAKGNMNNPLTKRKRRKIINQYDLMGNLLNSFSGAVKASTSLTGSKSGCESVLRCCRGGRVTWRGFIWVFENDKNMLDKKLNQIKNNKNQIIPQLKQLNFIK